MDGESGCVGDGLGGPDVWCLGGMARFEDGWGWLWGSSLVGLAWLWARVFKSV